MTNSAYSTFPLSAKLINTIEVNNTLAEGIQWHIASRSVWWTDIEGRCLYQFNVEHKSLNTYPLPHRLGSFAFCQNSEDMLMAFDRGIARYHLTSGRCEWLFQLQNHLSHTRFNDGRVDRQGRFWSGTMVENANLSDEKGTLYCLDICNQCIEKLQGLSVSNGLCWSTDGRIMYHTDSPDRAIYRYEFDPETATIGPRTLFCKTEPHCVADGACVDSENFLWSAKWGGGKVVRYTPSGDIDFTLPLSVSQVTNVAIGGAYMDQLFISSARAGLSNQQLKKEPDAGNIFIYQLNRPLGLPEPQSKS